MPAKKLTRADRLIRVLFGALAALLFWVASFGLFRSAKSTTDENFFKAPPGRLMLTRSLVNAAHKSETNWLKKHAGQDSVCKGDLLLYIDGKEVRELSRIPALLGLKPSSSTAQLRVFRPEDDEYYSIEVSRATLVDSFVTMIPPAAFVYEVMPGGASDLAGMLVGDLIYRINGQTFDNYFQADAVLRAAGSGETVLYDIIRNGNRRVLRVTLASFGAPLSTLSLFLSGLIFFGTGVFVGVRRPWLPAARLLGISFLAFGFVMMSSMQRDPTYDWFAQLKMLLGVWAIPVGLATVGHSKGYFPLRWAAVLEKRWMVISPYALALVSGGMATFWLFTGQLTAPASRDIYFFANVAIFLFFAALHWARRKQRTPEYKKVRRVLSFTNVSVAIATALGVAYCLTLGTIQNIGYVGLLMAPAPLALLYTIGRYHLLELDLRIGRNLQYTMVISLWGVALGAGVLWLMVTVPKLAFTIPNIGVQGSQLVILDAPPEPGARVFIERLIIITIAMIATMLLWYIGRLGQRLFERLFDREKYDLGQATGEVAEIMATRVGMDELARSIVERLSVVMRLKRVGVLFLRDQKVCGCQEVSGFDGKEWDRLCVNLGPGLVDEMGSLREQSRFSIDGLSSELQQAFRGKGFSHIIPIRFKSRLVGALIIGEKRSEAPLHHEDLTFLSAVARQASIAIENALLHEELREQERMKHELTIARRIQMASLPQETPVVDGLDISGDSIPALEVGGDYFDYLNGASAGLTVIVGDVSGKGTSAALYMSKMQGIVRSLHAFNLAPRDLFIRTNQLLCSDMEKNAFVTALGAFIDTRGKTLVLARAGHLPLFYYANRSRSVDLITPPGLGMGLDSAEVFATEMKEVTIDYSPGDVFLFVTDGITEAQTSDGREFGEARLSELLKSIATATAEEIRHRILREVKEFSRDGLPLDDQTIVVVRAVSAPSDREGAGGSEA